MKMKQRDMKGKEVISVGAKVDKRLHTEIKDAALRQGISMSTLIERAIEYYVDHELKTEG